MRRIWLLPIYEHHGGEPARGPPDALRLVGVVVLADDLDEYCLLDVVPVLADACECLRARLQPCTDRRIHLVALFDPEGTAIAATIPALVGRNYKFRRYLQTALAGTPVTSELFVSVNEAGAIPTIRGSAGASPYRSLTLPDNLAVIPAPQGAGKTGVAPPPRRHAKRSRQAHGQSRGPFGPVEEQHQVRFFRA